MIQVDISNIWGDLSLRDLLGLEQLIFDAHRKLEEEKHPLLQLPRREEAPQQKIWAEEILESSQVLVVLGDEGFAEGVVELVGTGGLQIIFTRGSFSDRSWNRLQDRLYGKAFSVCLGSRMQVSDNRLLRELKWLLERRYGTDEALSRIHQDPFGLITMTAAGLDPEKIQAGMDDARKALDLRSFENPAWLYAAARHLLGQRGKRTERLLYGEPELETLVRWWKNLFGGGHLSLRSDLLPGLAPEADSLDTLLRFTPEKHSAVISRMAGDPGGVNFLAGKTLAQVEDALWETVLETDGESDTPAVIIDCGEPDAYTLGWLYRFFRLSAALCGQLSGEAGENREQQLLQKLGTPEN